MTISSRFNSAEGKNFRRKRNININTCTFHSLSQRVSLREIFESKLEGRNFCANFPTKCHKEQENDRIVSFPRIPRLPEEGMGEERRGEERSKGSICRSVSRVSSSEKETWQQCFSFWPGLLYLDAAKTDQSTNNSSNRDDPSPSTETYQPFPAFWRVDLVLFRSVLFSREREKKKARPMENCSILNLWEFSIEKPNFLIPYTIIQFLTIRPW